MNNKKIFNLLIANFSKPESYIKFISHIIGDNYEIKLLSKNDLEIETPDLVLFTGGEDVHPNYYNELVGKYTSTNFERDAQEKKIYQLFQRKNIPKLSICRGAQFLTVMNGGKLIQHVSNHGVNHTVTVVISNQTIDIEMTSTHHQMMYPFNLDKKNYELIGHSTYFRSDTYLNGTNEEIKLSDNFLEPEIVYYNKSNSLCIQGHPENMSFNSDSIKIIKHVIKDKFKNFKK